MAESFDPYHKWLGIPPAHQPPTHYRFLGVEQFEADRDVIDAAANQRMLYLQDLAGGQFIKESQKLLNEVAIARRCLLNVESKAQYDAELRARVSTPTSAAPVAAVVVAPVAQPIVPVAQPIAPVARPVAAVVSSVPVAQPISQATNVAEPIETDLFAALSNADESDSATLPTSTSAGTTKKRASSSPASSRRVQLIVSVTAVVAFIAIGVMALPSFFKPKEAKPGKVTIRWPLNEREGAKMFVDDDPKVVPKSESFSLNVPAGKRVLVFKRRGSHDLEKKLTVKSGEQHRIEATLWWPDQSGRQTESESESDVKPKAKSATKAKPKK